MILIVHNNHKIATKGKANFLLKKSSVLSNERRPPRKNQTDFSKLIEYKEDEQNNEDNKNDEESKES